MGEAIGNFATPRPTTKVGSGVQTAPAAGTTIATIPSADLPAGLYEVELVYAVAGTGAADFNNLEVERGGVDFLNPIPSGASSFPGRLLVKRLQLDGSQALAVKNITIGSAGVEYCVAILATKVADL